jgi:rhodanese-related sulfurtransferase
VPAEVSVAELAAILEADPTAPVIDVRNPDEYAAGHVPGAVLIPMHVVPVRLQDIPRTSTVYLVCATGGRSAQTAAWLEPQGYDVVNVLGGTQAWVMSGLPVES